MFFTTQERSVSEETKRMISKAEDVTIKKIDATIDIVGVALTFPVAIPFMVAAAVIMAPISRFQSLFVTREVPMPDQWLSLVEARASDDGRFFVGRILSSKERATTGDAMRFLAIEAAEVRRTDPVTEKVSPEVARAELVSYYERNRTAFDKATTSLGGMAKSAVNMAGQAASQVMHKLRVGF